MEYLIIAGVVLAVIVTASFAIWLATKSAATAGAATAKTAQATAEAKASSAALDAAVQGTSDDEITASLKRGDF